MVVYGIPVLSVFSILILMCGIAVSSSPAVCRYSAKEDPSFGIRYFGFWYSAKEDPSRYCGTVHLASPV